MVETTNALPRQGQGGAAASRSKNKIGAFCHLALLGAGFHTCSECAEVESCLTVAAMWPHQCGHARCGLEKVTANTTTCGYYIFTVLSDVNSSTGQVLEVREQLEK